MNEIFKLKTKLLIKSNLCIVVYCKFILFLVYARSPTNKVFGNNLNFFLILSYFFKYKFNILY